MAAKRVLSFGCRGADAGFVHPAGRLETTDAEGDVVQPAGRLATTAAAAGLPRRSFPTAAFVYFAPLALPNSFRILSS